MLISLAECAQNDDKPRPTTINIIKEGYNAYTYYTIC